MSVIEPAPASAVLERGLAPAAILVGLLAFRWLAGIAENFGIAGLSERAALVALAGVLLLTLNAMAIARHAGLLLAGLVGWGFAGLLSAIANGQMADPHALELIALLAFYAAFANAAFLYRAGVARAGAGLLYAFIWVGAGLSLWQVATGSGFVAPGRPDLVRAFGSDVHPVSFGIQIVAAAAGMEILRRKDGRRVRAFHAATLAVGLAALYLTYARTAWAMAAIVLLWLALTAPRLRTRVAGAALCLATFIAFAFSSRMEDLAGLPLFLANFDPANIVFDHRFVDNSVSWRIVNWGHGLDQALDSPILGHGPGQSAVASAFQLEMHNILLEVFFEAGLIGLVPFCMVLAGLVRLQRRLPNATPTERAARRIATGFGWALLAAVMVSTSLVDQLMTITLYLMLLALARGPAGR